MAEEWISLYQTRKEAKGEIDSLNINGCGLVDEARQNVRDCYGVSLASKKEIFLDLDNGVEDDIRVWKKVKESDCSCCILNKVWGKACDNVESRRAEEKVIKKVKEYT